LSGNEFHNRNQGLIISIEMNENFSEYETQSLSLNEEYLLGAFEKKVRRRIFGYKREKIAVESKMLYNEGIRKMDILLNSTRMQKPRRM
jgi:hypothetical protein